jgi:DNA-binding NtrC family response regulator
METRFIWISATTGKGSDESRILELLGQSNIAPVTASLDSLKDFAFQDGDSVLFNGFDPGGPEPHWIELVRSGNPQGQIFVREASRGLTGCSLSGVIYLDAEEGPSLTRTRIVGALPLRAAAALPKDSVPAWRRRLVGESLAAQRVAEVIRLVGPRRCSVLITGETGTGKEVAARAIHDAGPRSSGPFVALNCSALPASLIEAELFGHAKGAFTGANQVRVGRFEQAHGGTLFLDEIGDLPIELQAKILRVLQERELQKLGSSETVRVDARIIAATNHDLQANMREGSFREDLFYRLNVVPLHLPPLRERIGDLEPLVHHFMAKTCAEEGLEVKRLTPRAWAALEAYDWPGNVRQLENAIASAMILSEDRLYLNEDDFPTRMAGKPPLSMERTGLLSLPEHGIDFTEAVNAMERDLLTQALQKTRGNKKAAAEMLRMKRTTLSAKVRVLDISQSAA